MHFVATYKFERFDSPSLELKTWEAYVSPTVAGYSSNVHRARATSAAPPYFKQFTKNETKCGYLDGALYHNNPVWVVHHESKLIWSDVSLQRPDILLSIGTGHYGPDSKGSPESQKSPLHRFVTEHINTREGPSRLPLLARRSTLKKFPTFTEQLWNTVASRFENLLNCNRI